MNTVQNLYALSSSEFQDLMKRYRNLTPEESTAMQQENIDQWAQAQSDKFKNRD